MILVADIGNTNIKLGILDDEKTLDITRISSAKQCEVEEYSKEIENFLGRNNISAQDIDDAVIASVVPSLTGNLKNAFKKSVNSNVIEVSANIELGVSITDAVGDKSIIGADRLMNTTAANVLYGGPCIVVSCGTAMVFDIISASGEFIGGAIRPGIDIDIKGLFGNTAQLPLVEKKSAENIIAVTTEGNIQAGVINFPAYGVKGMVDAYRALLGANTKAIITGGDGELIYNAIPDKQNYILDTELNFKGLRIISRLNRGRGLGL